MSEIFNKFKDNLNLITPSIVFYALMKLFTPYGGDVFIGNISQANQLGMESNTGA